MHSYLSFFFTSIFWADSETWEIANSHRGLCPPWTPWPTALRVSWEPTAKKVRTHIHIQILYLYFTYFNFWILFIVYRLSPPLLLFHSCGIRHNTSNLRHRECLPRSKQIHTHVVWLFRHRMWARLLSCCSLLLASSRSSKCFAGKLWEFRMKVGSRCQAKARVLEWFELVSIVVQSLWLGSRCYRSSLSAMCLITKRLLQHCMASLGSCRRFR